ncbi:MAG: UDP-3-O-acyl-N-acetylglucosamine deacetylase, partial [Candidatus Riflebacteria bacterium]|nr:UDP-3-O-acyl-N-acetylglucosamine deacetylase [Candidatus Riflebacteria bacterium]
MNNDKQKTIKKNATFEGIGLHTGKAVVMKFLPAPANTGIIFIRSDLPNTPKIKASLENVISTNRGTVLKENEAVVNTVEHVLSALKGLGVDNMYVDLNDVEPPVMDGSACEYVKAILEAGIEEQEEPKKYIYLKDKLFLEEKGKKMMYLPSDKFEVTFTLAYSDSIIAPQTIHV